MKGIKHVQLEAGAFISDVDFQLMDAEQRGVYWSIILYLYANGGSLDLNNSVMSLLSDKTHKLAMISNCPKTGQEWQAVWSKIAHKFIINGDILTQKRVTEELERASEYRKIKSEAGKKGMQKRWGQDENAITGDNSDITKGSKGKGREGKESKVKESKGKGKSEDISLPNSHVLSLNASLRFADELEKILKPVGKSDRTAVLNLVQWLMLEIKEGRKTEGIFETVLNYAGKSKTARNKMSYFFSVLDKEISYRPRAAKEKL